MENGLKNQIKDTFRGAKAFINLIKIKKPCVLVANQSSGYHGAIGEICKMENINAILISHGTHVPHTEESAKREWDEHSRYMTYSHFPYVAVQTPWTEKFLDSLAPALSTSLKTGPLLFCERDPSVNYMYLRKRIFQDNHTKKIILHAATPFGWTYFHPWIDLTHEEYIRHINDLIKVVENMENTFLALRIRLKSFNGMSLTDIKSLFKESDCYEIFTDGSFDEYLFTSDILVSFSSTTIEEALQNRIPVLQYDPFHRYSHLPAQHLKAKSKKNLRCNPLYYVSSCEELHFSLDWIMTNHFNRDAQKTSISWDEHVIEKNNRWVNEVLDL